TALDRANAEDAVLPLPKILDSYDKKNRHQNLSSDLDEVMTDVVDSESQAKFMEIKDDKVEVEADSQTVCMEDRLRSLGILSNKDDLLSNSALEATLFNGIDFETNIPVKKMRATILSLSPTNACKLLEVLVDLWQSRSYKGKNILQWIYFILVNHGHHLLSQESLTPMLSSLYKVFRSASCKKTWSLGHSYFIADTNHLLLLPDYCIQRSSFSIFTTIIRTIATYNGTD
ncbi:hypothetical protein CISIN_1g0068081mg, partial [Citrus sinensis]